MYSRIPVPSSVDIIGAQFQVRLKVMKLHIFSAQYYRFCARVSFRFEISLTLLARLLHSSVIGRFASRARIMGGFYVGPCLNEIS
jgi:hypothetical protein